MKTREAKRLARLGQYRVQDRAKWQAAQRRLADHYATNPGDLRKIVERERTVQFWGSTYQVTPRLVSKPVGNGRALLRLTPLNTRPNRYFVRVDDRWEGEQFYDHLDQVLEAVAAEFGSYDDYCDECGESGFTDNGCPCQADRDFPALNDSSGVTWDWVWWPAV